MMMCTPAVRGGGIALLLLLLACASVPLPAGEGEDEHRARQLERTGGETASRWTLTPLPLAFYTSDTGVGGGAMLAAERDSERPGGASMFLQTAGIYTWKQQAELSVLLQSDFAAKRYRLEAVGGFFDTPSLFFGVGPDADVEERYERQALSGELLLLRRMWKGLYGGILYRGAFVTYVEYDESGAIAAWVPEGAAVRTSSAGAALQWDSRSSMLFPRRGSYAELRSCWAAAPLGSEAHFHLTSAELRSYFSLSSRTVCAVRALAAYGSGDIPLHAMAELGGSDVLRGYPQARYCGTSSYALQGELRFPIYKALRGTLFAAAGNAGAGPGELGSSPPKPAGGAGLRIRPNPESEVQIRIDLGIAPESYGLYITLLEAF